ncbi:RDD family protein [Streptomyces sp. NPDC058855]|uniref:RDD family protein n=1 Tax=Streptomyces sp. NPDC058855 TaxID=3346651 RepID=UPI003698E797
MATPPGGGEEVPQAGYYPDPSIPGYIRYWNGGAWVPGTSRPAPKEGEAPPNPPAAARPAGPVLASSPAPAPASPASSATAQAADRIAVASPAPASVPAPSLPSSPGPVPAVEETGPVFLDEEPAAQEPAPAWQADTSRQSGFGGEHDRKISWGAPQETAEEPPAQVRTAPVVPDPRTPADWPVAGGSEPAGPREAATAPAPPEDPRAGAGAARLGGMPVTPVPSPAPAPAAEVPAPAPAPAPAPVPAPTPAWTPQPQPSPQPPAPAQPQQPHPSHPQAAAQPPAPAHPQPPAPQPTASVPPQAHPQPQEPVVPWKPPVEDPFLQAAREQASARPAGLGRRLLARLVDTLVLGALIGGASYPFVTAALEHIDAKIEAAKQSGVTVQVWLVDSTTSVQFGIALAAFFVLGLLYEALPTAKWGRTLGKKLCGIHVRDIEAHEPPTFGKALRRWLLYTVLGVLAVGVLNVLWCLFDRPWRQCWHDKAAGTFVAR